MERTIEEYMYMRAGGCGVRGADGTRTEEDRRKFEVHNIKLSADGENDRRIHATINARIHCHKLINRQ